jgi:hypothetical protein
VYSSTLAVTLSREKYASLADATREVERLGIKVVGGGEREDAFRVLVRAPASEPSLRNSVMSKLEEKDMAVSLDEERVSARFSEIKLDGAQLLFPRTRPVPAGAAPDISSPRLFAELKSASIAEPVVIPADAWVLLEEEAPSAYLWTVAIAALLVAFMAFNVWYLLRRRT